MKRLRSSIQAKVFGVVFAHTLLLVAFLTTYFPAQQIAASRETLLQKARSYAGLVARQVEPALIDGDRESVREVFAAVTIDPEVRAIALRGAGGEVFFAERGEVFFAEGDVAKSPMPSHAAGAPIVIEEGPGYVRGISSVAVRDGAVGTLYVELGTGAMDRERARVHRVAVSVGIGSLLVGLLVAWWMGRSLSRRLGLISTATSAVAGGDLSQQPIVDASPDELGQLSRSFNTMTAKIRALLLEIRHATAKETERLEVLVRMRTVELRARNKDMRTVLDNVAQGFLTVDRKGIIGPEHSRVLETWFAPPNPGTSMADYLGDLDPVLGWRLKVGWEAVVDDYLPLELALDQMPKTLREGGRHFSIEYRPIVTEGTVSKFLVVISDVTSEFERENAHAAERELVCILDHVARDRAGFIGFMSETDGLVKQIVATTDYSSELRRCVHTLKGNAAVFGLSRMADLCHEIEERMGETAEIPSHDQREDLALGWGELRFKLAPLLERGRTGVTEVHEAEIQGILDGLAGSRSRAELAAQVALWRLEPAQRHLDRLADHAHGIARRLDKPYVRVVANGGDLRLDGPTWAPFWSSLVHVVRNALDHGIEPLAERTRAGKPSPATVTFAAGLVNDETEIAIEITDDGRGVDWDDLAACARRVGLLATTPAELEALLFADGLSTKRTVDLVSGRGMGMSAVKATCAALGGRITVNTAAGAGTTFTFTFPASAAAPRDQAAAA